MDARKLEFEDASIDLVIDKGTTDAVLCGMTVSFFFTKGKNLIKQN